MSIHNTPEHRAWYRKVKGQIRDCIHAHPELFCGDTEDIVRHLSKRIVGEIVAVTTSGDKES